MPLARMRTFTLVATIMLTAACGGPSITIRPEPARARHRGEGFTAGMASVDITPPPGLPSFGYSEAAEHDAFVGYRTRLRAHALVMQDADGVKVALVTADLGCVTALLHWSVAERVVAGTGLGVDRILISATHTHSGPAGIAGESFYNRFGSPGLLTGFDESLYDFLSERVARAIVEADRARAPARIAVARRPLERLTLNRSLPARMKNDDLPAGNTHVDPTVTMIRVDHADSGAPIGAYIVYAGHPTVIGVDNELWHGDAFGLAVHHLKRRAARDLGAAPVFALANGAEGDVSFSWRHQAHYEAIRMATRLADGMYALYTELASAETDPDPRLDCRYEETSLPGAATEDGSRLSEQPRMGVPTIGGAEDGRSALYGKSVLGQRVYEGARYLHPHGSQGHKKPAFGWLQGLLVSARSVPRIAPVQIVQVGGHTLVGIPFEPTTQMAHRVEQRVAAALATTDSSRVTVVGLANGYIGYCTTESEYEAQHYEGSSTLYGPRSAAYVTERCVALAIATERAPIAAERTFEPGYRASRFAKPGSGDRARRVVSLLPACDAYVLTWIGLDPGRIGIDTGWLVQVQVLRGDSWSVLRRDGIAEDDRTLSFSVRNLHRDGSTGTWQATWFLPPGLDGVATYRLVVAARDQRPKLASRPFRPAENPYR